MAWKNRLETIAIVGGGPAGSSLAIRLASKGFGVTLIERDRFPRHKLCGEFISPECLAHFEELGVRDGMLVAGVRVSKTVFYDAGGRAIEVPSTWFGAGTAALSLSRAQMDHRLIERAKEVGVKVLEGTSLCGTEGDEGRIASVKARQKGSTSNRIGADFFVDATGRARVLARLIEKGRGDDPPVRSKPGGLVGFKAHLRNTTVEPGTCEIYSFPGGYGGLSPIEAGLSNHCFLVRSEIVRELKGDAGRIVEEVVQRNKRARRTLEGSERVSGWLAVSVDGFGIKNPTPAENVVAIGDSAAFIDPFTGSGILMALESSALVADTISRYASDLETLSAEYRAAFRKRFALRLRVCSLLRRAAFNPAAAKLVVALLGASSAVRQFLTRSTRGSAGLDFP